MSTKLSLERKNYFLGLPFKSCASVVAHCFLQIGKHSDLDFCSSTFGFVQAYTHLLRHASNFGSFLDPVSSGFVFAAIAAWGKAPDKVIAPIKDVWRKYARLHLSALRSVKDNLV